MHCHHHHHQQYRADVWILHTRQRQQKLQASVGHSIHKLSHHHSDPAAAAAAADGDDVADWDDKGSAVQSVFAVSQVADAELVSVHNLNTATIQLVNQSEYIDPQTQLLALATIVNES